MKKMFEQILPSWISGENPKDVVEFTLSYDSLPIGYLSFSKNLWMFKYTKQFSLQNKIKPLTEFPDLSKTYESETLWPFFASRIPSLNRPEIKKILEHEDINANDLVDLLVRFGKNTITNPFELELNSAA